MGPLLFCLTLQLLRLNSNFCVAYVDDVSIGGLLQFLLDDIEIMKDAENVDLFLNLAKSEIIGGLSDSLRSSLPGAQLVDPIHLMLLFRVSNESVTQTVYPGL